MPAEIDNKAHRVRLPGPEFIFGTSVGMCEVRERIERAAHDNLPVLIEGESGTGKETMGRFLYKQCGSEDEPFLKLNCGVSTSLLEGKIFGFERTKFAVGLENHSGSIGLSSKGTLFLDEIDSLDSSLQQKLACALMSGRFRPIEGREDLVLGARLICATTIDQEAELRIRIVEQLLGCFVHRVRLLPLRERRDDIPQLCEYLLEKFAKDFGRPVPHLSARAVEALQQWKWPGNIRELENWIARIVIFGAEEVVGLQFKRQLTAGEDFAASYYHASRSKTSRARRPRTHR